MGGRNVGGREVQWGSARQSGVIWIQKEIAGIHDALIGMTYLMTGGEKSAIMAYHGFPRTDGSMEREFAAIYAGRVRK